MIIIIINYTRLIILLIFIIIEYWRVRFLLDITCI